MVNTDRGEEDFIHVNPSDRNLWLIKKYSIFPTCMGKDNKKHELGKVQLLSGAYTNINQLHRTSLLWIFIYILKHKIGNRPHKGQIFQGGNFTLFQSKYFILVQVKSALNDAKTHIFIHVFNSWYGALDPSLSPFGNKSVNSVLYYPTTLH